MSPSTATLKESERKGGESGMIGISELLAMRRWLFVAYRFASEENARAVLHERFKRDYTLVSDKVVFVMHWATTHARLAIDDLVGQRWKKAKPTLPLASRNKFKRRITCLTLEGPQTFLKRQATSLTHYILFGDHFERDCYIAWEGGEEKPLASEDGLTLRMQKQGRGVFYTRELTYQDGWLSGCETYAVLISFQVEVLADVSEQRLVQSKIVSRSHSSDPFTGGTVQFGTQPLDEATGALIRRAKEGYEANCVPYPRDKEKKFREYVRQELLAKQDRWCPPKKKDADGLPWRDRFECTKQTALAHIRLRLLGKKNSYLQWISGMRPADALATVWEPWQLILFFAAKMEAGSSERSLKDLLADPWSPWSRARADRIMAFYHAYVRPHLIEDWD